MAFRWRTGSWWCKEYDIINHRPIAISLSFCRRTYCNIRIIIAIFKVAQRATAVVSLHHIICSDAVSSCGIFMSPHAFVQAMDQSPRIIYTFHTQYSKINDYTMLKNQSHKKGKIKQFLVSQTTCTCTQVYKQTLRVYRQVIHSYRLLGHERHPSLMTLRSASDYWIPDWQPKLHRNPTTCNTTGTTEIQQLDI